MGGRTQRKTFSERILKSPRYPSGRGELFLREGESPVYQLKIWIPSEQKELRRSLRTTDYETALIRAEEMINKIHGEIAVGAKIFGITLGQLVERYIEHRQKDVDQGEITRERLGTIRSQLRALLRVKSPSLKLSELDADSFLEWRHMRREDNPNVSKVTLRNEIATIGHMFKWSFDAKIQRHIPALRFEKIRIRGDEVGRRDMLTDGPDGEYAQLTKYFRTYCSAKECPDPEERYRREDVRDYILILANSCMRTGELNQLRWGDIKTLYPPAMDDAGLEVSLIKIEIRGETSKVRNSRTVIVRGGEYFKRIRKRRNGIFIDDDDFVFPNLDGTAPITDRQLYPHWYKLMEAIGIPKKDYKGNQGRQLSFYGLRHFAITRRLQDNSIFDVAQMSGTSSLYIEKHYAHPSDEVKADVALRNSPTRKRNTSNIDWE